MSPEATAEEDGEVFERAWRAVGRSDTGTLAELLAAGLDPGIIAPGRGWACVHELMYSALGRSNSSEGGGGIQPPRPRESREEIARATVEMIRLFARYSPACIHARDRKGNTALMLAAGFLGGKGGEWCRAVLEELLVAGADPNVKDNRGRGLGLPLRDNQESVALLRAYGWSGRPTPESRRRR